jgi:hypothetical protein
MYGSVSSAFVTSCLGRGRRSEQAPRSSRDHGDDPIKNDENGIYRLFNSLRFGQLLIYEIGLQL